jgi:hypothetical protein
VIPLRDLHQIELTSRCNLKCAYCVSPTLKRPKIDMSQETFAKALKWLVYFVEHLGQEEINIAGIGESTIHPQFIPMLKAVRLAIGPDVRIVMATNGKAMTADLADAMKPWNPRVFVSMHQPVFAKKAFDVLRRAELLDGVSADPTMFATDWAGQIKNWTVTANHGPCDWVRGGKFMVMSDGRLTRCSFDGTGVGVFGTLDDDLTQLQTTPYALCRACHLDVGLPIPAENNVQEAVA